MPRRWNIGISTITIDSDLHAADETARTLMALAELSRADLPTQLKLGPRAVGTAQHAAQIAIAEASTKQAMVRGMGTDRSFIDHRARVGLYQNLLNIIISPSSIFSQFASALALLAWGVRLALVETLQGQFIGRS